MPEIRITPISVLEEQGPLVLTATFRPVAGLDRFQPAGFPEVGHVIYKAPREDGAFENVCIVDSPASMANHLEALCMRGPHDLELVEELEGMPYLRCVTGDLEDDSLPEKNRETVVTSLTEGHRIASTYFLDGRALDGESAEPPATTAPRKKGVKRNGSEPTKFAQKLANEFGIIILKGKQSKAYLPADSWWSVFKTICRYDPNALVHGVLFPQWQIKLPRVLTAHLEAFGASRVDRSGVKFDRLGKTNSGQPIFAVDDATAREIRAIFILDSALVRSFGRSQGSNTLGLDDKQKEFLVALALWKVMRMCEAPFRFRSGCHLKCVSLTDGDGQQVSVDVDIRSAIMQAGFQEPKVTDIFWAREDLYREGESAEKNDVDAVSDTSESGDEEESD